MFIECLVKMFVFILNFYFFNYFIVFLFLDSFYLKLYLVFKGSSYSSSGKY